MDEFLHNWRLCFKCAHKTLGGDIEPYEFDESAYLCGKRIRFLLTISFEIYSHIRNNDVENSICRNHKNFFNGYRRKRPKVDARIFDSALSQTRRSDASEKKREENSVSTFGRFRLWTSFESLPVSVNASFEVNLISNESMAYIGINNWINRTFSLNKIQPNFCKIQSVFRCIGNRVAYIG